MLENMLVCNVNNCVFEWQDHQRIDLAVRLKHYVTIRKKSDRDIADQWYFRNDYN